MPAFITSPFQLREALTAGKVGYSWGSLDTHNPGSRFQVTSVAITSNVATIGVKLLEGPVPIVGNLISVQGTQTVTSGGAPNFNVIAVALTAVSVNSSTGIGTLSFALSSSNIATTPDAGAALVPVQPVAESLTQVPGKQFAISAASNASNNQRGISWFTVITGSPTVSIDLEGSDDDVNYSIVDTSTAGAGEQREVANQSFAFYRINPATVTDGTNPTMIAGIREI